MPRLNILYLGSLSSGATSYHRLTALRRLGHNVIGLDPLSLIRKRGRILNWIDWNTGYILLQPGLLSAIGKTLNRIHSSLDLIWVSEGQYLGPSVLRLLKSTFKCRLFLHCVDDPTGTRDMMRFWTLRRSMSLYDLGVCSTEVCELEWLVYGFSQVVRLWLSYDEVIHGSMILCEHPRPEVSFIGTNIPGEKRDLFLLFLAASGIALSLYGNRWQRSRTWNTLSSFLCGLGLKDRAYASQLAHSALSLGLLSHGNRDLHTRRSVEIPACAGVLLGERTSEHQLLYEDGVEALLWDTADECSKVAKHYLGNPQALRTIRDRGSTHARSAGLGNEDICRQVLATLLA